MNENIVLRVIDCLRNCSGLNHCKIVTGFENEDKPTRLKKIRIGVFQKGEKLGLPLISGETVSYKEIFIDVFLPYTMTSQDCDATFEQVKKCLMDSEGLNMFSFYIGEMGRDSTVDMYVAKGVLKIAEVIDCE